jgi:GrpB-like predicted nucleotidyltransferase (UPF0157 family)
MLGLNRKVVIIEGYNDKWPDIYKNEEKKLFSILKDMVASIEHVGSTSIPGLKSKPIIDIAIGLCNFDNISVVKRLLISNGYEYRANNGSSERYLFVKGLWVKRTHHLHVEKYGESAWNDHIDFRDCLRNDSTIFKEYEALKVKLAEMYSKDRESYTAQKADYIQMTLKVYRLKKSNS